jgi:hypothetical protein
MAMTAIRCDLQEQQREGVRQVKNKHDVACNPDGLQCAPCLTLELSGGEAVRLERVVRAARRAQPKWTNLDDALR